MEEKIDKLLELVHGLDKRMDRIEVRDEEHLRRTSVVEMKVEQALAPLRWAQATAAVAKWTSAVVGFVGVLAGVGRALSLF